MNFNLVFDRFQNQIPLANLSAGNEIDEQNWCQWPYTVMPRFVTYCQQHHFSVTLHSIDSYPKNSWYPIAFGHYKFDIDYFQLLSDTVKSAVINKDLRLLFYYHEGDNPKRIEQDLSSKCLANQLPMTWKFVSANTTAGICFDDHELFYRYANRRYSALQYHDKHRSRQFTALNRLHKWWRATIMTDLIDQNLLDQSYWSYNGVGSDDIEDTPIQIDQIKGLRTRVLQFVGNAPYRCDELEDHQHNQHSLLVAKYFEDSYIHFVFETFFDVDQSGGTFLTEKTFKPIKHAQPFLIFGPPGTLQRLRALGYRTFDHEIDSSYDAIIDNTQRWFQLRKIVKDLSQQDLRAICRRCRADVIHNQKTFLSDKFSRLETLYNKLHETS